MSKCYFVYILTNYKRTVLYIGVTNNLKRRILEHQFDNNNWNSFTKRYKVFYLVYYETFYDILKAIDRETAMKKFSRKEKETLIKEFNPEWRFLNKEI
ncbi:GIY-YIG nuclease family protein [Sphingobacterium daejeonense]|uniref:GIY-YIG nuclease family protein n=1 Tax=Sphingobacterium daejeonense TaxID=371142 RepID=A0ABW3RNP8_9SPHI